MSTTIHPAHCRCRPCVLDRVPRPVPPHSVPEAIARGSIWPGGKPPVPAAIRKNVTALEQLSALEREKLYITPEQAVAARRERESVDINVVGTRAKVEFTKNDSGKLRYSLIPADVLDQVVRVLEIGAAKYSPDNWQRCTDLRRYWDAAQRHLWVHRAGERVDPESNQLHVVHAICCLMFLAWHASPNEREKS